MIRTIGALISVGFVCLACSEAPTSPEPMDAPVVYSSDARGQAANRFSGAPGSCLFLDPDGGLWFGAVSSVDANSNNGRVNATCEAEGVTNTTGHAITADEIPCQWIFDAEGSVLVDLDARLTIRPDGRATAKCTFQEAPPNAFVSSDDGGYPAQEGVFTTPLADLGGEVSGDLVDIGPACDADLPLPGLNGKIALILRMNCPTEAERRFDSKIAKAEAAGAIAAIIYNTEAGGDALVTMGGVLAAGIPGVFVGHSAGLALQSSTSATIGVCRSTGKSLACQGNLPQN